MILFFIGNSLDLPKGNLFIFLSPYRTESRDDAKKPTHTRIIIHIYLPRICSFIPDDAEMPIICEHYIIY